MGPFRVRDLVVGSSTDSFVVPQRPELFPGMTEEPGGTGEAAGRSGWQQPLIVTLAGTPRHTELCAKKAQEKPSTSPEVFRTCCAFHVPESLYGRT